MYSIGQKVVCIKDDWSDRDLKWIACIKQFPKVNHIYSIRDILKSDDEIGFILHEIINPVRVFGTPLGYYGEPAFNSIHFRPLINDQLKTSISMFDKFLGNKKPTMLPLKQPIKESEKV